MTTKNAPGLPATRDAEMETRGLLWMIDGAAAKAAHLAPPAAVMTAVDELRRSLNRIDEDKRTLPEGTAAETAGALMKVAGAADKAAADAESQGTKDDLRDLAETARRGAETVAMRGTPSETDATETAVCPTTERSGSIRSDDMGAAVIAGLQAVHEALRTIERHRTLTPPTLARDLDRACRRTARAAREASMATERGSTTEERERDRLLSPIARRCNEIGARIDTAFAYADQHAA